MIGSSWPSLVPALGNTYASLGLTARLSSDLSYLEEAFGAIETLWEQQFRNLTDVRVVLLAEAPLFGSDRSYFYNPRTGVTAFFTYSAAEPAVGKLEGPRSVVNGSRPRKELMIRRLTERGIIMVELFPFALNEDDTATNYNKLSPSLYRSLFEATAEHYFMPKIVRLSTLMSRPAIFVFRYERLQRCLGSDVVRLLAQMDLLKPDTIIESIHKGQHLDGDRLAAVLAR